MPELDLSLETASTPETTKEELIEIQDTKDGASFKDMGIDLDKLGDTKGENLESLDLSLEATNDEAVVPAIDLETASETSEAEEAKKEKLDNELESIEDFTAWLPADIDESTLIWILDATILKLNKREEVATEQIENKRGEVEDIQGEIRERKAEERAWKKEITELEAEKKKIVTTRESIEKMKEAA